MNKFLSFFLLIFVLFSCSSSKNDASQDLYKSVSFLNQKNDSLTIGDVIKLYHKGDFNIPMENKVFYDLKGKEATWLSFKVNSKETNQQLFIWNPFLEYSKVYTLNNNKTKTLREFSLWNKNEEKWNYRFPNWKIEKSNSETIVFIKVKDSKNKSAIKLLLQNEADFKTFIAKDFTVISIQASFLLVIIFITILLFLSQRKTTILWYGAYVFVAVFEFLIHKGIDLQLGYTISPLFHSSKRVFFQNLGLTFVLIFFIKFYNFSSAKRIKKLFKIILYISIIFNAILLIQYALNFEYISKVLMWQVLRIGILAILISHIILSIKKVIPFYLSISFTFPILGFFIYAFTNPPQDFTMTENFLFDNIFQLTISLEVTFIFIYIIRQLVKSQFLAVNLKNENLALRNSFQDSVLNMQQKERNKLLGNVHDSFGGYLEALKLRLMTKAENTPEKIQEILDAFYKEYRYLLNSLYAPKINSENFIDNLIEFCDKLNQLTNSNSIQHQFSIENTQFSQEKCVHLYRIISELATNAIKHANASEILIHLSQENTKNILLTISDNGTGFDINNITKNSYGLNNIEKRVKNIGGKMTIETEKNKGTEIKISIPKDE